MTFCEGKGVDGLADRANLIRLQNKPIYGMEVVCLLQAVNIGYDEIIPDQVGACSDLFRTNKPIPVILVHKVFDEQ